MEAKSTPMFRGIPKKDMGVGQKSNVTHPQSDARKGKPGSIPPITEFYRILAGLGRTVPKCPRSEKQVAKILQDPLEGRFPTRTLQVPFFVKANQVSGVFLP